MDQIIQSLTHEIVFALLSLLAWLVGELIHRTRVGRQLAQLDRDHKAADLLDRAAVNVALLVEEHFAAKIKAGLSATAQDKATMFVAELLEHYPHLEPDQAMKIAQATLPKIGIGAAKAAEAFLVASTRG